VSQGPTRRIHRGRAAATCAAAAVALLACAGPREATPAARGGEDHYGFQVLELRDAALAARDVDAAARAYAPDAEVIDAATGAVALRGRDAIREAHARFLAACPRGRLDVLDRSYAERGRFVTDRQRVRCDRPPGVEGSVRYEVAAGSIVRVLAQRSPLFTW
jgi:hypothetical protein